MTFRPETVTVTDWASLSIELGWWEAPDHQISIAEMV